jgi:hypothetical protein
LELWGYKEEGRSILAFTLFLILHLHSSDIASHHGTRALQKKLATELGKHIEKTAPHVKKQLQSKKEDLINRLLKYGVDENGVLHAERANNKKIMWQYVLSCRSCLHRTISRLSCIAVPALSCGL